MLQNVRCWRERLNRLVRRCQVEEGKEGWNTSLETGRKGFSEAEKRHLLRTRLDPHVKYCRKLGEAKSVKSYRIWHEGGSWGRRRSQIVGKDDLETEGFE